MPVSAKRYDQYTAGTYDTSKIFLQADAATGALEKVNLPTIYSLPSQSGNAGKYLNTNGTIASWATVVAASQVAGSNTQIQYNAAGVFGASSSFTYANLPAPITGIARALIITPSVTAAANNDVLVGVDINPTFNNNSKTGTAWAALRVQGIWIGTGKNGNANNIGMGISTMGNVTTGNNNVGIGHQTYFYLTTGLNNVAIGFRASTDMTTGSNNVAIGSEALRLASNPTFCVAVGNQALYNASGTYNTAIGASAMGSVNTGSYNTCIGSNSLRLITSGSNNMGVGLESLYNVGSGSNNVGIGSQAGNGIVNTSNNIMIGYQTSYNNGGSGNIYIGFKAGFYAGTTGTNKIIIGSIDRGSYANELLQAAILVQQSATIASQIITFNGVVSLNTVTPNASAVLQADSTTQGILLPRMTSTEKNAITAPAAGLIVYDTTLGKISLRTAGAWETVTSV